MSYQFVFARFLMWWSCWTVGSVLYSRIQIQRHDQAGRSSRPCICLLHARVVNKGSSCCLILSSFPWTATQPLVTCGGLRSITTPTDMLNVKNFPTRGIPDGRLLAERIAAALCWTRAAPASNQEVNRTEWCCVRQECTSPRCEQVKSRIGC